MRMLQLNIYEFILLLLFVLVVVRFSFGVRIFFIACSQQAKKMSEKEKVDKKRENVKKYCVFDFSHHLPCRHCKNRSDS